MSSPRPSWAASSPINSPIVSTPTATPTKRTTSSNNTNASNATNATTSTASSSSSSSVLQQAASPRWADHHTESATTVASLLNNNNNSNHHNHHTNTNENQHQSNAILNHDNSEEARRKNVTNNAIQSSALSSSSSVVSPLSQSQTVSSSSNVPATSSLSPAHSNSGAHDFLSSSSAHLGTPLHMSPVAVSTGSSGAEAAATAVLLHGDEFSLRFFLSALVGDKVERRSALALLTNQLVQPKNIDLLKSHINRIVRMHSSSPLRDWTDACDKVIQYARQVLPHVPVARPISRFFDQSAMLDPFTDRESGSVRALFRALFLASGRLSYLDRVISFRPEYSAAFHQCQQVIMRDAGPLPLPWRNYIALVAASRHRCAYLCELQTELFLHSGGDKSWLDGIASSPTKMQAYAAIDAIVAHQPWLLKPSQVQPLLRGNDAWTIGEIVHAMVISATIRALAGIVAGCGINHEVDFVAVNGDGAAASTSPDRAPSPTVVDSAAAQATELVIKRLQLVELTESGGFMDPVEASSSVTGGSSSTGGGGGDGAAIVEQFDRAGQEDDFLPRRASSAAQPLMSSFAAMAAATATSNNQSTATTAAPAPPLRSVSGHHPNDGVSARLQLTEAHERETAHLLRYIGPYTLRHADFNVQSDTYKVFRANDWSWQHQGYELLLRFLPRLAQPLDNLFELTQTMTDNCFNTFDNVDTGPYRRAVWQYVQRIKGVLHDDYDYQDINIYLNKFNKEFVKKIVCYPEFISAHDFQQLGYVMGPHEKLHLCALVVESRKQAELLYGLHAVMSTMNPSHQLVNQ